MGHYPYVARGESNNGIRGYINSDEEYLNPANTISFGQDTATMNYQKKPYFTGDKIQIFKLNKKYGKLTEEVALYLITTMKKAFSVFSWGQTSFALDKISYVKIYLPTDDDGNLDIHYMEDYITKLEQNYIAELEQNRIAELDAYLKATGLDNYKLTDEDREVLDSDVNFGKFKLGGNTGLFNIHSPLKKFNANTVKFNGKYPYVARGSSNNGIRGYITENEKYLCPANTLSFGQDTATVFYQPNAYFTGDKIKVMELKDCKLTQELAEYLISAISAAFSAFEWGQNSFSEKVLKNTKISIPVKSSGEPDFNYMKRYIRVIEKLTIADIVKHRNNIIFLAKRIAKNNA